MNPSTVFAAQLLETGASGYAGVAAGALLEKHPALEERFAPSAFRDWKDHLHQRILDLSAALEAAEPGLFASRVRWERVAFRSRDLDDADLHRGLTCLREVLDEELPEMAKETVDSYVTPVLEGWSDTLPDEPTLDPKNPVERLALTYLEAALRGDGVEAVDLVVQEMENGMDYQQAYEALMTAQRESGRLWHLGELKIAEEHLITTTTERATSVLAQRVQREPSNGKTVIVAAVAGNRHSLPVRVVADFFSIAGWRSICLGADLPPSELAAAAEYFEADAMALSVAMSTQIKHARATILETRKSCEKEIRIVVGGSIFDEAGDLWQRIGADGYIRYVHEAPQIALDLIG